MDGGSGKRKQEAEEEAVNFNIRAVFWMVAPLFVYFGGSSGGSAGKKSAYSEGDPDSIPGLERFPGEGNGYLLQHSCLENSKDR